MSLLGSCWERDCKYTGYIYGWYFIISVHVWSTYIGGFIIYSAVYHRVFWFRADLNLTHKTIQKNIKKLTYDWFNKSSFNTCSMGNMRRRKNTFSSKIFPDWFWWGHLSRWILAFSNLCVDQTREIKGMLCISQLLRLDSWIFFFFFHINCVVMSCIVMSYVVYM